MAKPSSGYFRRFCRAGLGIRLGIESGLYAHLDGEGVRALRPFIKGWVT